MEFIGEEMVNDAFNYWLEKNGFEARVFGLENAFAWNPYSDLIYYSVVMSEQADIMFYEYVDELGLKYEIDNFWLAFLHELGHSETWCFVEEEDYDIPKNITNYDYYRLPREAVATEWAVRFINEHADLVRDLTRIVGPVIDKFFELNEIER